MVSSRQYISFTTRLIRSIGHGDPAMTPVRSELRSNSANRGCSNSEMNMVGTPYSAVQRSSCTASSVASGSNCAAGSTSVAPEVSATITPITQPKQ